MAKNNKNMLRLLEHLEIEAKQNEINARRFIDKIAALKEELAGGSASSILTSKKEPLTPAQIQAVIDRRRKLIFRS